MMKADHDILWYVVTDEARFRKKTPEFGSLVFFEIAYNDGLEHYLTSSRGETHEKYLGGQICTKIGPEIRFFTIFSRLVH